MAASLIYPLQSKFKPLSVLVAAILCALVLAPLIRIVIATIAGQGLVVWQQVLLSEIAANLFWQPLLNSLTLGVAVSIGCVLLGGFFAYLVVLTDVPGRVTLGILASIPFVLPSFALALAWEIIFRNTLIGGHTGVLTEMGMAIPDWLAWGFMPTAATLTAHYFSLAFMMIAAGLTAVHADVLEAGEMAGASQGRIVTTVALPMVLPTILAAGLLAFAEGVSNFAVPAILGLPVRFHTLSTRLYGMINTGQTDRGYVLAVLLILVAAVILWAANRAVTNRRSYAIIAGKGGRRKQFHLGPWRWIAFAAALVICFATTIIPGVALIVSSLTVQSGSWTAGFTLHYWIGASDPNVAQGYEGILRNAQFLNAAGTTILLGGAVAILTIIFGLAIGYVIVRDRLGPLGAIVNQLSYLPILIPGIAFGAAYIAQFGRPIGPLPALYGTFALLVLAGVVYTLPFSAQSGRAAMSQIANELDEAARLTQAKLPRRLLDIFVPLTARGLIAGGVLVFVKMVRDLSLVILLATPATALLSIVAFRFASEGFPQLAHAATTIIAVISLLATIFSRWLQGAAQPWIEQQ